MVRKLLLLKLFIKPQRHTPSSFVTATVLATLLMMVLSHSSAGIFTVTAIVILAILSLTMNEVLVGLMNRRRDVAVLLALGVRGRTLGLALVGKTLLQNSLSCLLGVASGYLLLIYYVGSVAISPSLLTVLLSAAILVPTLLAGTYGLAYTFRLNIPEALRQ